MHRQLLVVLKMVITVLAVVVAVAVGPVFPEPIPTVKIEVAVIANVMIV